MLLLNGLHTPWVSLSVLSLCLFNAARAGHVVKRGNTCTVLPSQPGSNSTDDSGAILSAFEQCKEHSRIVFPEGKRYNIERVMETVGLNNVTIDMKGYLLVSWSY